MKYWILVTFSLTLSLIGLKSQTLDTFNPAPDGTVNAVALQPDGAVLILGTFLPLGGWHRYNTARLYPDGSVDPVFNPGGSASLTLASQPDGKIIYAGSFTNLAGQFCKNIGRVNPDGTFDPSFSASADNAVFASMVQPDGRILVSGVFSNLDGQPCNKIGRLNSDGSLDSTFNASTDGSFIRSFALQPDGKILVGGGFTNLDGAAVNYIGRLNTNGSLDHTFNSSASGTVWQVLVQSNNLILVGGDFTNLAGASHSCIGRLNTDGTIDSSFNPGASDLVRSMALQANGRIIVSGDFTNLASAVRNRVGRLNANGTLDSSFNPGANNSVRSVALQSDGKVIVAGSFTNLAGGLRFFIGRLTNNDAAAQSLTFNASSVTWSRAGSSPEIWNARFEFSTNGTDWTYLADGLRVSGGWQAAGLSIPSHAAVRAFGYVTQGGTDVAGSLVRQLAGRPVMTQSPADSESVLASNVTFTATAEGTSPLAYQWQFNGTNLINGPKISGATNASLVLSNVTTTNIGLYALIITNSYGAITSRLSTLKVVSPTTNDFDGGTVGTFYTTAAQANGKRIYGGNFSGIGATYGLERANFNGSMDPSFLVKNPTVYSIIVQPDGDIVAGGSFTVVGTPTFQNIERVHPDGSVDAAFTNKASGPVNALALQPDGKILLGGDFTLLGNQPHKYIGRLNSDGTVDTNFNASLDYFVNTMALQANGQIIIGGEFTNVNGVYNQGLARLNSDGTRDATFAATYNATVSCVAVQADGKILASVPLGAVSGVPWGNFLMRLNPDGSLDTTFNATPGTTLNTIALQADGKAFLGGGFTTINGATNIWYHNNIARIKNDGTTDFTFVGGASSTVLSIGMQFDGGIMVSGIFGQLYDISNTSHSANASGHFKNNEEISNLVSYDGSTVSWTRTGPAPECSWVLFDFSVDGTNWSSLGQGVYTNNSWQVADVSLPPSSIIRASGYVAGGYRNGSGWMIEARSGPPFFLMNPTGVTNGFNYALDGWATGTPPLAYQWIKDGVAVTNDLIGKVSGAQTRSLFIKSTVGPAELGHYQLMASNAFGCVTSSVAIVTPSYPWLDSQPFTVTTNAGATVSFPVTIIGATPIVYQWFNGTQPLTNSANISGATNSSLTLSNLTEGDSGSYWLAATNVAGSISNLMATLTVVNVPAGPAFVNGSANLDRAINGFGFDLTASVGQTIVIETSSNLVNWQPVLTNLIDSSPFHFQDLSAITNRNGFYRLRPLQ